MKKTFTKVLLIGYFLLTLGSLHAQGFIINGADVVVTSGADIYVDGDANGGFTFTTAGGDVDLDGDIRIEGDWSNLGPTLGLTNRDVDGYVYLVGTTNQSVGGGGAASATHFENLTLNNAAGATASVDLNTIESVFHLEAGIFTLNQLTTVVDNTSTAAITRNTGSLRSEDNTAPYGTLRWNIATATGNYSIPFSEVGNTLIPLGFNVTGAGTAGSYFDFAMYHTINTNTPLANGLAMLPNHATGTGFTTGGQAQWRYVLDRWFMIDRDAAYTTNPTATLTFTYIDTEHSVAGNLITEANLQAQRWNESTSLWEGYSWINGVVNTGANTVTVAGMQADLDNENWVLVDNTEPLPIELLGYDANCDGDVVTVSWASASETNNDYYTIEKSLDGVNWDFVATISGAGNSNQTLYYYYTDYSPMGQLSYYKLSQTDYDGSTVELGIEQANCGTNTLPNQEMDINLYADMYNNIYVTYYANKGDKSTISLFDDNGKLVIQEHIVANDDGMNSHQINAVGLSFGIYFVNIIGEDFNESKKVLLKK
jgi:Secretion system C-terminal sorting domain